MQVVLPDFETRASLEVRGDEVNRSAHRAAFRQRDRHSALCRNGTGYRNNDVSSQLGAWAKADGRGVSFDSSAEFILPTGAAFAADASWVLTSRLASLTKQQKKRFVNVCPDFVVELRSPSDRLPAWKAKMEDWIENGAQQGLDHIVGEGPVDGFRLELKAIWEGV